MYKDKNMAYISIIAIVAIVGMFIMFFSTTKQISTDEQEDLTGQASKKGSGSSEEGILDKEYSALKAYEEYVEKEIQEYVINNNIDLSKSTIYRESTDGQLIPGTIHVISNENVQIEINGDGTSSVEINDPELPRAANCDWIWGTPYSLHYFLGEWYAYTWEV